MKELLAARHAWKRARDRIEVVSKVMGGLASVVAFGASAVKNPIASDWMSFGSGCIGTLSLTLMLFSNYSGRVSKLRTRELNTVLKYIGVTPVPQISSGLDTDEIDDSEVQLHPSQSGFDKSLLEIKRAETV